MIKRKLVTEIVDLYSLNKGDFLGLEKVKEKLAEKFVETINKSKTTTLPIFLTALALGSPYLFMNNYIFFK